MKPVSLLSRRRDGGGARLREKEMHVVFDTARDHRLAI
jgi:hypothetical protein